MRRMRLFSALLVLAAIISCTPAPAQQSSPEAAIRAVMTKQTEDWNRGDLEAFAKAYKESPGILFIGSTVRRGYDQMLATYRQYYGTPEKRGTLTYTNVEVHPLDEKFAVVLGNFHLERTAAGGGNADGLYSLVFENTPAGWKIVLDHTSNAPKPAAH